MSINDMKNATLKFMESSYPSTTYSQINDQEIENKGFMLKEHAEVIRNTCSRNSFIATFRAAGPDSIIRIKNGNPCKGHNISDKSIKMKNGSWTYTSPTGISLNDFKGIVGHPISDQNKTLDSIWKYNGSNPSQPVAVKISSVNKNGLREYYTGDYDMHDLLKNKNRILAGTPDEGSAIDSLNNSIYTVEPGRKNEILDTNARTYKSEYALIRHGAQTSFMSFLLSNSGASEIHFPDTSRLPLQGQVITIDNNIVAFDESSNAYLLDSIPKVYSFYKNNNLLDQIPFYYFFEDLSRNAAYSSTITGFVQEINNLLARFRATVS